MDKKLYKELTGENPEDMFGPDYKNEIDELLEDEEFEDSDNDDGMDL